MQSYKEEDLALLAKTIRMLSVDAVEAANSGHPGMPMGTADMASVLWSEFIRFSPGDPEWIGRDRFILSAGHGSMLLYSLLHLFGYELALDEITRFRQWESKTPGHPEYGHTPGVETTTGPLGQGFANGVGIALSEKMLEARYGQLFGSKVYGIVSDGDLMEGLSSEAASLAGHLGLDNLIYLYDDNEISIGGSTDVCFTESVPERFRAQNWFVQSCDGHDISAVRECIKKAIENKGTPSIICARTTIGKGSPNKAGSADSHGAPLGSDEVLKTKQGLSWPEEPEFFIPDQVSDFCRAVLKDKESSHRKWLEEFKDWQTKNSELNAELTAQRDRSLPTGLSEELFEKLSEKSKDATRNLSGKALQIISKQVPSFLGGSADLEPSNKTLIKESGDISSADFNARNIRFGVREHAMGTMVNGLAYTRMWIPYSATFLVFADYMRPAIRLAALSKIQSLFIFTHDSFWVGEDGPTHQPIEHIWSLRIIPGLKVFRPADGLETAACYMQALEYRDGPSALLFTRQGVPSLNRDSNFDPQKMMRQGAYVLANPEARDHVIVATGSEVWLAAEVAERMKADQGISYRVVSMPCVEIFEELSKEEQNRIVPAAAKIVTIEAGSTIGWRALFGPEALCVGIDHFGASAPGEVLADKFGFSTDSIIEKIS